MFFFFFYAINGSENHIIFKKLYKLNVNNITKSYTVDFQKLMF